MGILNRLSANHKIKLTLGSAATFLFGLGILYATTIDKPIGEEYKPVTEYGGDFILHSSEGDIALADYRDKVVVAYFGFLNCTEACPISMATAVKAIGKLTPEERAKLQVFFISVDPERDTLEALNEFSQHYAKMFEDEENPNILMAISGSKKEIETISEQYGVYFDLVDLEGSGLGYTVDHSSRFYMIGGDGKLNTTMNHSTTAVELAAKIKELQNETIQ